VKCHLSDRILARMSPVIALADDKKRKKA
jgi:hypothetical protein